MYPLTYDLVRWFIPFLFQLDMEAAAAVKKRGCPHCGGALHSARYVRKPRGGCFPEECCHRLGLCCSAEGCRRRTLPPSILFFGRRVYWSAIVVVVASLRQGRLESRSAGRLVAHFGMSRKTISRWMTYFREVFPSSSWWQRVRGRVGAEVKDEELPGGLFEAFVRATSGPWPCALIECLRLLASGQPHHVG